MENCRNLNLKYSQFCQTHWNLAALMLEMNETVEGDWQP